MKRSSAGGFGRDVANFVRPLPPPRGVKRMVKVLTEPGLQFVLLLRFQLQAEARGQRGLARLIHLLNLRMTGGEVGHGSEIGPGLVVKHPLGVVIGGGTRLGADCTVLHNVTFGEVRPGATRERPQYPRVGNGVLVGNAAVVLGGVSVGDNATIGAGAVVLRDVAPGTTVVGVPARALVSGKSRGEARDES